jgi:SAM-dependent methyltransferase
LAIDRLNERYAKHHQDRANTFVFGGDERARLFRAHVGGPGHRILDVGCRYGALTRAYLEGNSVVGIDVDRQALAEAAKLGIETQWVDIEAGVPFENGSFDVVVAGELLEHLREPELLVAEAQRVLRPGGRFVASVPNAFRLKNRLLFALGRPLDDDPTHLHLFRPADVSDRLLAGFSERRLDFIASRFLRISPRLFGNAIVFTGVKHR